MRKIFFFIIVFMLQIHAYAQNTLIEYQVLRVNGIDNYNLITNNESSVWQKTNSISDLEDVLADIEFYLFKDKLNNEIYFNDNALNKVFDVKDTLFVMKWKITPNKKISFLGFDCNEATTVFRGRKYIAKFTTDLPLNDGPWKFCGLPGIILSVSSDDNKFNYNAVKIVKNHPFDFNTFKVEKSKSITWEQFKEKYIEIFDKWMKQIRTSGVVDDNSEVNIQVISPEIIYPKVQKG